MIKFLVMDVDGTLTDGMVYIGEHGELFKAFDIKDGCGIKEILPKYNVIPVIITARESAMLALRCAELGIQELHQGCREKLNKLMDVMERYSDAEHQYSLADVAYIGDDLLDLKCMVPIKEAGGFVVCPHDAIKEIKAVSDYICNCDCGKGAIREFIDWYASKADGRGLEEVRNLSPAAYDFIRAFNSSTMADGKYKIGAGVFANVMTYITKPLALTSYEAHKKYIDIQYILYGEEILVTENTENLVDAVTSSYREENDVEIYNYDAGNVNILTSGDAIILYPQNAHRGAIAVGNPMKIRKIVVKVPASDV